MSDLSAVVGRTYGPFTFTLDEERIAAFVAATNDDAERWSTVAPPGYAAATLFHPAPAFFADPDVAAYTSGVIHADQTFTWHQPWVVGEYQVTGTVDRIRDRRGVAFVSFSMTVDRDGQRVLDAASTFLMSAEGPTAAGAEPRPEPPVHEAGTNDPLEGDQLTPLRRSASRADLVRYASASSDFNPIHWDHDAATGAGLAGVVCHGLLLANWLFQSATRLDRSDLPLAEAKLRFKTPVLAAAQCEIVGTVTDAAVDLALEVDGEQCVTGRVVTQ